MVRVIAKVLERHMSEPLPPTAVLEALPISSLDDLRRPVEAFRFPKRDGAVVFVLGKAGGGKSATMVRLMRMAAETSLFRCGRFYSGSDLPLPSSRAASDVLVWDVDRPVSPQEVDQLRAAWKLSFVAVQASRRFKSALQGSLLVLTDY